MARKTQTLVILEDGRDKGKIFVLTEMAADAAERWALRALFALANTGIDLPDDVASGGMAGVATVGLRALGKLPYAAAEPLLGEMLRCAKYRHAPDLPLQEIFSGDACQIEEARTFLTLRMAIFELHVGFTLAGAPTTTG